MVNLMVNLRLDRGALHGNIKMSFLHNGWRTKEVPYHCTSYGVNRSTCHSNRDQQKCRSESDGREQPRSYNL